MAEVDRTVPTRTQDGPPEGTARSSPEPVATTPLNVDPSARPPGPVSDDPLVGRTLLHFDVLERLGQGGMGVVYRAFDARLRRDVAIKVLNAGALTDPDARARLFREARRAAALVDPRIAAVYEIHDDEAAAFFVMELVVGETLRARLGHGPLPISEAVDLALQLAGALAHAHAAGIVHRDVKPENILLTASGQLKLLDFGIAKRVETASREAANTTEGIAVTRDGHVLGTPEYMAPEQALGRQVNASADVFAVGVVLYEMLAGIRPFLKAGALETAIAVVRDAPVELSSLRSAIPSWLSGIVTQCLEKEPTRRFSDAGELETALRNGDRRAKPRRHLVLAALGTVGTFVFACAGIASWRMHRSRLQSGPTTSQLATDARDNAPRTPPFRLHTSKVRRVTLGEGAESDHVFTSDGRRVVYTGRGLAGTHTCSL